jgi:hypothetical protein
MARPHLYSTVDKRKKIEASDDLGKDSEKGKSPGVGTEAGVISGGNLSLHG